MFVFERTTWRDKQTVPNRGKMSRACSTMEVSFENAEKKSPLSDVATIALKGKKTNGILEKAR